MTPLPFSSSQVSCFFVLAQSLTAELNCLEVYKSETQEVQISFLAAEDALVSSCGAQHGFISVFKCSHPTACTWVTWGAYLECRLLIPNPRDFDADYLGRPGSLHGTIGPLLILRQPGSRTMDLYSRPVESLGAVHGTNKKASLPPVSLRQPVPLNPVSPPGMPGLSKGHHLQSVIHAWELQSLNMSLSPAS